MDILVINCGSSSIKYQVIDLPGDSTRVSGTLERIGEAQAKLTHTWLDSAGARREKVYMQAVTDHHAGFSLLQQAIAESGIAGIVDNVGGIGHRVVHGGEAFKAPTRLNAEVIATIRRVSNLAPLHNPPNLLGVEIAMALMPQVPHVAVFDTAFHQTMPDYAFRYALPESLYRQHGVRRYGFHGTSHAFVAKQAAQFLRRPLEQINLITLHLGNGASAAAIQGGRCLDTSMGLTPLEGLVMGTRSGDIDPAIPYFLSQETKLDIKAIDSLLNKQSGLKGLCGANDMREIHKLAQSGNRAAKLAIDVYCYRIKKYIGAYCAALGSVDALVFTAGIGENAAFIRAQVCASMDRLGFILDAPKNQAPGKATRAIHAPESTAAILVVPTNEELEIARQTLALIQPEKPTASEAPA